MNFCKSSSLPSQCWMRLFCDFQRLCTFKNLEKWTNRKNLKDNFGFDRVSNVAQRNWVKFRVTYKEIKKLKIGERNRDVIFFTGWPRQSRIVNHPRWKMRRREQFYGLFSASLSIFQSASPHDYSIIQSNFLEKIWIFSRCNQSVAPLFSKLTPLSTGSKEFFDTKFSRQLRHFEVGKKLF